MRALLVWLADLISVLALAVGSLAAVAALAAQGGRVSALLDVIGHFALVLFAASLATLAAALVARRWARKALVVLGLVAGIASAALIAPELLRGAGPKAASAADQIKIIQFNALETNADVGGIVDWVVAQKPDLVTTQETRHDLRDALKARTGWHVAGAAGNLMIFSREPRLRMNRPAFFGPGANLHWVNATYPSASGPYEVVTVHLDWPTGTSQSVQWATLADLLHRLPTERMILTGDFNSTPFAFVMRRGERAIGLTRRDRALASFPAKWHADGPIRSPVPILPIDHVYAGPGWATVKVERGPGGLGSDHYPLIVTLAPVARR